MLCWQHWTGQFYCARLVNFYKFCHGLGHHWQQIRTRTASHWEKILTCTSSLLESYLTPCCRTDCRKFSFQNPMHHGWLEPPARGCDLGCHPEVLSILIVQMCIIVIYTHYEYDHHTTQEFTYRNFSINTYMNELWSEHTYINYNTAYKFGRAQKSQADQMLMRVLRLVKCVRFYYPSSILLHF